MKFDKALSCPYCQGTKVVRNGIKKNGKQNLLCKTCSKQFQPAYVYQGCIAEKKELVLKMLCRGSGVRDSAVVSGMSRSTVLAFIKTAAANLVYKPKKHTYRRVQIDEQSGRM